MLRLFARRMTSMDLSVGTDKVAIGWSLPSDTVIHNIRLKLSIGAQTAYDIRKVIAYATELWILPVPDPDAGPSYDDSWDALVPKDTDVQTLDLDTAAADTSPFYEPGEVDWSDIFEVGVQPERLFHRHKLLTFYNGGPRFVYQDNQTPFTVLWIGGDHFVIEIKRRLRVRQPSVLVCGFASPNLDDTTAVLQGALNENEWPQVKYMGEVLKRAMLHVLGLTEAGAETPWEEATALLIKHLDPDVYEQTAAAFQTAAYYVTGEGMLDHSVVGDVSVGPVSTGR